MDYVLGLDIYSLNRPGDQTTDPAVKAAKWKAVSDEGVKFIYAKATEGDFLFDRFAKETWQEAKDADMLRGWYHFFHPEISSANQANFFIKSVDGDFGELPPALDLEEVYKNGAEVPGPVGQALLGRMKDWLDRVEQACGRKPMIYTRVSYLDAKDILDCSWGMDYPLWLAHYPTQPPNWTQAYTDYHQVPWDRGFPKQPAKYQPWTLWQCMESGQINGLDGEGIDVDFFKGTLDDLNRFAGRKTTADTVHEASQRSSTTALNSNKAKPV